MSSGAAEATVYAWLLDIRSVVYEGRELPSLIRYAVCNITNIRPLSSGLKSEKSSFIVYATAAF